ncbi:MAG TPA: hypothetical protein VGR35_11785 [Tepidisphaeraceae bacterium]|nr:hypothetical protein [Tepidisphaeraceae bacterium]
MAPGAKAALIGAGAATVGTAVISTSGGLIAPFVFIGLAPFTIPAGAIIGGVSGASLGPSKADIAIAKTVAGQCQTLMLRELIEHEVRDGSREGPWRIVPQETQVLRRQHRKLYHQLASQGFDHALEMKVLYYGLRAQPKRMSMPFVVLETRMIDTRTGRAVYRSTREYRGQIQRFEVFVEDWELLRDEMQTGSREVVRKSCYSLFYATRK